MKHFLRYLPVLTLMLVFNGCKEDLDLEHMDNRAEVKMGIALPVGDMRATLGDFLGGGKVKRIYVDSEGIFHFNDTVDIPTRNYHPIYLEDYIIQDANTLSFDVPSQFPGTPLPYDIPSGQQASLTFPVVLGIEGVNDDIYKERLDSMYITHSQFISKIDMRDFDLHVDEIQSVTLTLGDQFTSPEGKTRNIPLDGYTFGSEVPIYVDNYTMSLLKDRSRVDEHVDSLVFHITFNIKTNHPITLSEDSRILYNMRVKLLQYKGLWGYFEPDNRLDDTNRLCMDSLWDGWKDVKNLKLRLMEPSIDVAMSHHVAAPFILHINYMRAINSNGEEKKATWDGATSTDLIFNQAGETINPYGTIGDSVILHRTFSENPSKGHIDQLFDVRPDTFSYSYDLRIDQNRFDKYSFVPKPGSDYPYNQLRLTDDSLILGKAVLDIPFKFNKDSEAEYYPTFTKINISSWNFDSIVATNSTIDTIKANTVLVFTNFRNTIPFKIGAYVHFLDQDSVELPVYFVQGNDSNHVIIQAPKMSRPTGSTYGYVTAPSDTTVILHMDNEKFNMFTRTKTIRMDAYLIDNPEPCVVDSLAQLKVSIGVAADVEAIINWENTSKNK